MHQLTAQGVDLAQLEAGGSYSWITEPVPGEIIQDTAGLGPHTHPSISFWTPEHGGYSPNPGEACLVMSEVLGHFHFIILKTGGTLPWTRRFCDEIGGEVEV
jgi:hypothetical protein